MLRMSVLSFQFSMMMSLHMIELSGTVKGMVACWNASMVSCLMVLLLLK